MHSYSVSYNKNDKKICTTTKGSRQLPQDTGIRLPDDWQMALDRILQIGAKVTKVMLVGETDTCKSTLALALANRSVATGYKTYVVDADIGQHHIGPPTVVSVGKIEAQLLDLSELDLVEAYFIGSTRFSPQTLMSHLTGTRKMVEVALRHSAQVVVIDTTGLVHAEGAALKTLKAQLVEPEAIVCLQRSNEVDHLVRIFRALTPAEQFTLRVPIHIRRRSRDERITYRRKQFMSYFHDAKEVEIDNRVPVIITGKFCLVRFIQELPDGNLTLTYQDRESAERGLVLRPPAQSEGYVAALYGRLHKFLGLALFCGISSSSMRILTRIDSLRETEIIELSTLLVNAETGEENHLGPSMFI